ncbi:hypothetical protein T4D_16680 [Trichinella pseudospiralis]|uniref:Uncharacterized protein n=1 Tax=Trichinella pseudospiralis TaxID=6337 RepID=A0A0V1G3V5_TRIPS|nr:hypothetical protein T4D_16680 [Trichinella pseudospiralis]
MTVQDKLFGHFFNQSTKKDPEQTGKYFKMLNVINSLARPFNTVDSFHSSFNFMEFVDYLYLACAADMDRANGIFPLESKEEET